MHLRRVGVTREAKLDFKTVSTVEYVEASLDAAYKRCKMRISQSFSSLERNETIPRTNPGISEGGIESE
jgi:hypothetical protein